jgi:hypothetical protein
MRDLLDWLESVPPSDPLWELAQAAADEIDELRTALRAIAYHRTCTCAAAIARAALSANAETPAISERDGAQ